MNIRPHDRRVRPFFRLPLKGYQNNSNAFWILKNPNLTTQGGDLDMKKNHHKFVENERLFNHHEQAARKRVTGWRATTVGSNSKNSCWGYGNPLTYPWVSLNKALIFDLWIDPSFTKTILKAALIEHHFPPGNMSWKPTPPPSKNKSQHCIQGTHKELGHFFSFHSWPVLHVFSPNQPSPLSNWKEISWGSWKIQGLHPRKTNMNLKKRAPWTLEKNIYLKLSSSGFHVSFPKCSN